MSDFRTGVMVDPGEGASRWTAGDAVTTDPASADFFDAQAFDVMFEAGKISIETEKTKTTRKTTRKTRRKRPDPELPEPGPPSLGGRHG